MRYILVTEGPSDRMLFGPIEWLLRQHCAEPYGGDWANPAAMNDCARELDVRLAQTQAYFPADLAFVHRDTDTETRETRCAEIREGIIKSGYLGAVICVVPVRMTEAWFLFNADAVRRAADKPSSINNIALPNLAEAARRADPKSLMEAALIAASQLSGRRLEQFKRDIARRTSLVADYIDDYSPLRSQESFRLFERELVGILNQKGWAR